MSLRVINAMICLDCDAIFNGDACPDCTGRSAAPLKNWISPLKTKADYMANGKGDKKVVRRKAVKKVLPEETKPSLFVVFVNSTKQLLDKWKKVKE